MELVKLLLKPSIRMDDRPDMRGTRLAAAGILLDEIACVSHGMNEAYAAEIADGMLRAAEASLRTGAAPELKAGITAHEAQALQIAEKAAGQLLPFWWREQFNSGQLQQGDGRDSAVPVLPQGISERYRQHIRGIGLAFQRMLRQYALPPGSDIRFQFDLGDEICALLTRPVSIPDRFMDPLPVAYPHLRKRAELLVSVWALRVWERPYLQGLASEALASAGKKPADTEGQSLALPIHMLAGVSDDAMRDMGNIESLTDGSLGSAVVYIRKNAQEFELRNSWWRRSARRLHHSV